MPTEDVQAGTGPGESASGVATLVAPPAPPKRIPHEFDAYVVAEYGSGKSQHAIAREFGVSQGAVERRLHNLGVFVSNRGDRCRVWWVPAGREDHIIAEYHAGKSQAAIGEEFGVPRQAVRQWLKQLGAPLDTGHIRARKHFVPEGQAHVVREMYASGSTQDEIGEKYSVPREVIRSWLKELKVPADSDQLRHRKPLNHAAFSEITEESAYWAGFLMADGCVYHPKDRGATLSVGLAVVDLEHVEKLKAFLGSGKKVSVILHRETYIGEQRVVAAYAAHFSITSDQIIRDLARFGVTSKKSTRECVSLLEMNRDFWRGYVDGDGNLGINKHPAYPEIGCPIVQIVGSAAIVSQFADYVRSVVPTSTVKGTILKRCPSVSTLSVTAWSAVAVARALYSGATIYLDRKMVLAERVMRWSEGRRKGSPVAGGRTI